MRRFVLAFFGLACTQFLAGQSRTDRSFHPQIPKAWTDAAKTYAADVRARRFPGPEHCFGMK